MKLSILKLIVLDFFLLFDFYYCHAQNVIKYECGVGRIESGIIHGKAKKLMITFHGRLDGLYKAGVADTSVENICIFKFDVNGNIMTLSDSIGRWNSTETFKYDVNNKLLQRDWIDLENWQHLNNPIETTIYKYDIKGNKVEDSVSMNDSFESETMYYYDSVGHLIKRTDTTYQKTNSIFKYKYDMKGNRIEEIGITYAYGQATKFVDKNKYDSKNHLIEKLWWFGYASTNAPKFKKENYKYDTTGNIIEEIDSYHNNGKTIFKYENYDSHNNWLKKKIIFHNRYIFVSREIEYY